jgi:hypothetical protein
VAGDFNGDGKLDLAAAYPTSAFTSTGSDNAVSTFLGNGDGSFADGVTIGSVVSGPVEVGDFNGDGKADLVVSNGIAASTLLGNGDGTFTKQFTGNTTPLQASDPFGTADFNGDGKTDLAIVGFSSQSVWVYLSRGLTQTATATVNNISLIGTGTHQIQASYPGDTIYGSSVSTTIGLTALSATTLALNANPSTSTYGQQVVLTATLTPQGYSTDGETIQFFQNGTFLGTATLTGGVAVLNTTSLTAGSESLQAKYLGDAFLAPSTSTSLSYTVVGPPSISFAVPNSTYGAQPFTVVATSNSTGALTYSVVSGPATISGSTVTVTGAGTVVLQASQVAAGNYGAGTQNASFVVNPAPLTIAANNAARVFGAQNPTFAGTVSGAVNGDTFTESFATTATPASIVGSYTIVPSVTGAHIGNYSVTPTNGTLTVTQAGTATTFALSNQNTTLTANVVSLTTGVPTGSVNFYQGQTLLGTGPLSNGVATYKTSSPLSGTVVVTAQYGGDVNFTQSSSPPIFLLSVAPASSSLTVATTGSTADTLNLSAAPGYAGTVQFSCANLPPAATCSFQPSSVSFTGTNNTASTSLTLQTGVATQASLKPAQSPSGDLRNALAMVIWMPGLAAMTLSRRMRTRRARIHKSLLLVLLCCMTMALSSCSGGSSSGNSSRTTPVGAYTIQVVASGSNGLSQTANLNLTVQ